MQLYLLLLVMLSSGVAEMVSLGAVLPFLVMLTDLDGLWEQPMVQALVKRFGLTEASDLLLPITLAFVAAVVSAALIRLENLWLNGRLVAAIGSDLSSEAYRRTLYQPYEVHLQSNSSKVITTTTTQINLTIAALNSFLQLVTSAVVAAFLLVGLLLVDVQVAVTGIVLFASAYTLLAFSSRRELRRNSQKIAILSTYQLKSLQEGLGAIRDVLLDSSQNTYVTNYQEADRPLRAITAKNTFLGAFPRYVLEALGMVAIAIMGATLLLQKGSGADIIPVLGTLALGAQRFLPSMQSIYSGWAIFNGYRAAIQAVLEMLDQPMQLQLNVAQPLKFHESICMESVHFRYGCDQPEVLRGLNFEIRQGERIGFVGSTGSGKSTTVDLLMGLLAPFAGRMLVDGQDLYDPEHPERLASWRAAIAHVPQTIFLADSSVAENIAFGIPREQIDHQRVRKAAAQAQISTFIESSPEGYNTFVGERGVRLSGGQRQRIGIARALYKNASVIVLDEATSALDTSTEAAVMVALDGLSKKLTVVMIAHRLSTLQCCDRIIKLAEGRIQSEGLPSEILSEFSGATTAL